MKKGFLFGLGVLIAGGVLAATISTVSITSKTPGDTVTNEEFNSMTTGLESLTDSFNGTTSDATSITIPKEITTTRLSTPEICLDSDCKTAWPTEGTGGTSITAMNCPSGQQLQSVTADGEFTCGTDLTGTGGGADLTSVDTDILPEMTGATPLMGNPPGSPSVVSVRNIGSATKWFKELWVEDLHLGNQSLYMNGVKILESDPAVEMTFSADADQDMTMTTVGDGILTLRSQDALMINIDAASAGVGKDLSIINGSKNGKIILEAKTAFAGEPNITLDSPKVGVNTTAPAYTLDVNGDINFTGTLYQNGVAFSGGGEGGTTITARTCAAGQHLYKANADGTFECSADTGGGEGGESPWSNVTNGITYNSGSVGIGVTNPVTSLDVSGGKILAEEFCINTPGDIDTCTTKSCAIDMRSGENGSTCFTQATLAAIESALDDSGTTASYWAETPLSRNSVYANVTGSVGIGTNNPSSKLHVSGGSIKISESGGTGGDLIAEGSIQVGGHYCPAPGATCSKAGEIASCGAGGQILACAGTSSQWMPITSHNGTIVGTTTESCTSAIAGKMRFVNGTTQTLQICMKLQGSATYSWRTIMSGGGEYMS